MHPLIQQRFEQDFPKLGAFYCECSTGWALLLYKLLKDCYELTDGNMQIMQIKEKFSTLRAYLDTTADLSEGEWDDWHEIIEAAEEASGTLCEVCGEAGERRGGSWLRTLCDEHAVKRKQPLAGVLIELTDWEVAEKMLKAIDGLRKGV